MASLVYKCPGCDGPLTFNASSGKFTCDYCLSAYNEKEITDALNKQLEKEKSAGRTETADILNAGAGTDIEKEKAQEKINFSMPENDDASQKEFEDHTVIYNCSECGAELIADETTAATFCAYCHSPALLPVRLSGVFRPSYVIPFKVDKKTASSMFEKYIKGRPFLPGDFKDVAKRDSLSGIYVPFWLFDSGIDVHFAGTGHKVRSYRQGDYRITETSKYEVVRDTDMEFLLLPVDASSKIDDRTMDLIEPFDYSEMKEFSMAYLSGFLAEKYDEDSEVTFPRAKKRIETDGVKLTRDTASGYSTIVNSSSKVSYKYVKSKYALLPAWIMNYKFKGKNYLFAINGQTGRMVGKLPVSFGKIAAAFAITAASASALLFVFFHFFGGSI